MGMYLHIDISPTMNIRESEYLLVLNYVRGQGDTVSLPELKRLFTNLAYTDSQPIELWVLACLRNLVSSFEHEVSQALGKGQLMVIPSASEDQLL